MAGNYTGGATVIREHSCANISAKSSAGRLYHRCQTQTPPLGELAVPVNYYPIDLPDPRASARVCALHLANENSSGSYESATKFNPVNRTPLRNFLSARGRGRAGGGAGAELFSFPALFPRGKSHLIERRSCSMLQH
jgi:hypothetical protein